VTTELLSRHSDSSQLNAFLTRWQQTCAAHGVSPRLTNFFIETARQDAKAALALLDQIHQAQGSPLALEAAALIGSHSDECAAMHTSAIRRGLVSENPEIVISFLRAIQYRRTLRTDSVLEWVLPLAATAQGPALAALIDQVRHSSPPSWSSELTQAILTRRLSDEETDSLAEAVLHWTRYGDGELTLSLAAPILNRLADSASIKLDFHEAGFLHAVAERHPRLLFEMLRRRVERLERDLAAGAGRFDALPSLTHLSLAGIEHEPDFETIARGLRERVRSAPSSSRWAWTILFTMTVASTSRLFEPLLLEWLPEVRDADELSDLARLTKFEGSLVIFRFPKLTEAILERAMGFGPDALDLVNWDLIHGAGPQLRSYTDGALDVECRYLREEAEKAVRTHEPNSILGPFFQKILENELRDEEYHRRSAAEDDREW